MELEEPRQLFNNPPWIQTWLHQLRNQYSVEHELDDGEFQENFVDIIPEPWTVCCLTMDIHHDDLYLVRLRAGESPFVVKLPLNRLGWRSGAETVNGIYENAATEFKEIIQQSDDTIHSSATYMENNDVDGWWKQRMALDQRLKMLLTSIEHDWFGGFKGLLCGQYQEDEEALSQLCQMVTQLVYKAAYNITDDRSYSNKKCININSTICRMLVRLGPDPSSQDLQDVIYYLLSCYENQDVIVQYSLVDMPQLQEQFASAIRRYHQKARKAGVDPMQRLPNDHVILILDKYTQVFPLESLNIMRNQSVSRLPCLSFLRDRIQYVRAFTNHQVNTEGEQPEAWTDLCVDRDSAFYILNPTGDLKHTQNEFESLFNNMKGWTGLVEKRPMEQECRHALRSKDLYM
ncbi:peptidase family C50-domain-containing protein [Radiomyces spectabilis]|uniref:peptidase family C50-domain-containing protein n=1 Tax=Radiomyces spectabilis TaxID=64574 RepID=UPI002220688E|nr:peptidase family C50-domain-containing protein [Radiomyces spectabilis]KAI8376399.1 peptidase family C50-domain-containing protein [Radiomyces spectabilis]